MIKYRRIKRRKQLGKLIDLIGLKVGIEVGVWKGEHAKSLLEHSNLEKLYLLDAWRQFPAETYFDPCNCDQNELDKVYEEVRTVFTSDRTEIVRDLSVEGSCRFADGFFDFIYIDANHHYEEAKRDVEHWWPKLREGGLFAGHDYLNGVSWVIGEGEQAKFGVKTAVDEFAARFGLQVSATEDKYPTWYVFK
jgi:hypothetical protein